MPTIISISVTSDHAVPISVPSNGMARVKNVAGSTLYYADNPQVTPASSQGAMPAGQSLIFWGLPVWVCSASPTSAVVTLRDATELAGGQASLAKTRGVSQSDPTRVNQSDPTSVSPFDV